MSDLVRVEGCRLPLGQRRFSVEVAPGQTIADIVRRHGDGRRAVVQIEGESVPPEMWSKIRVKSGTAVAISPEAGELGTILLVLAAFVVGAAIVFLLPAPGSPEDVEQQDRLEGGRNRANPYGPMPVLFGRMRYAPPAINPWIPYKARRAMSESASNPDRPGFGAWQPVPAAMDEKQWIRTLLLWSIGEVDVSDIRLDATPAADYGDSVELVTSVGPNADFPTAIRKVDIGADLNGVATVTRRIGRVESDVTINLVWPQGLYRVNDKGEIHGFDRTLGAISEPVTLIFTLKDEAGNVLDDLAHTPAGGTTVTPYFQEFTLTTSVARDCVLEVSRDRQARASLRAHDDLQIDSCFVPLSVAPIDRTATTTSVRIQSTDQISRQVPAISGVGIARRPDWDGDAWVTAPTRKRGLGVPGRPDRRR